MQPTGHPRVVRVFSKTAGYLSFKERWLTFYINLGTISITTAASRCTWALARDKAIPFHSIWAKVNKDQVPVNALLLMTVIEMLLGLIDLGSSVAFTAFASVGTIALAVGYAMPVAVSLSQKRHAVASARFRFPSVVGWTINILGVSWIAFVSFCKLPSFNRYGLLTTAIWDVYWLDSDTGVAACAFFHAGGLTCYFDDNELGFSRVGRIYDVGGSILRPICEEM